MAVHRIDDNAEAILQELAKKQACGLQTLLVICFETTPMG